MAAILAGKCALITGSTAGLGFAIAEALAAQGCNIVLNGIAPADEGSAAQNKLAQEFRIDVVYEKADISQLAEIERLVGASVARFGSIDIVVNNAVARHFAPIEKLTPAEWEQSLAVNLSAPFHIVRLVLPMMRARGWGRIFNLSSYYGSRGAENRIGYVTTKTALIGMTRAIALEADDQDITCNAICPGTLATPDIMARIDKLAAANGISADEATRQYLAGRRPAGRFVGLESVGALIAFLCSPGGRDITGAVLPVDGGWTAT
ncbi:MAG: SDR family oxidoreductase [Hyphomicrobiaceae bacterium]